MRTTPARMDLLSPRTAALMRLLVVLVVLFAVGCPLAWGVTRVAVSDRGEPVVAVDGRPAEPTPAELAPSPIRHAG
jgi:TRAP-type C4-dicarboxylate transport system permease small subunit